MSESTNEDQSIFIGIDGGATNTRMVALDINGKLLAEVNSSESVSPFFIGHDEAAKRLCRLLGNVAAVLQLSDETFASRLHSIGLGICGFLGDGSDDSVAEAYSAAIVETKSPLLPPGGVPVCVFNDVHSVIGSAFPNGGIVLVAGTGSNCVMTCRDTGRRVTCGGWEYILADEGSAFALVVQAFKHIVNSRDHYRRPAHRCSCAEQCRLHDVEPLRKVLFEKMNIQGYGELLSIFGGSRFSKAEIASHAVEIAKLANDGDRLSQHLFCEAGRHLAAMLVGVVRKARAEASPDEIPLDPKTGSLNVLCPGSVFKSWPLLKRAFLSVLQQPDSIEAMQDVRTIVLNDLCVSNGFGAAALAAAKSGKPLNFNRYDENVRIIEAIAKTPKQ